MIDKHREIIEGLLVAEDRGDIGEGDFWTQEEAAPGVLTHVPCCTMGHVMALAGISFNEFCSLDPLEIQSRIGVPSDMEAANEWGNLQDAVIEANDEGNAMTAIEMVRTAFEEMEEGIFGRTGHDWSRRSE
jgi:hypothetical protein